MGEWLSETAIAAVDLRFEIGRRSVIKGATFEVKRGESYQILASSGAGKTTLLKLCAGLLQPDSGRIYVEGRDFRTLPPEGRRRLRERLRFVFEDGVLLSNMTIQENISLPLVYHTRLDRQTVLERVRDEMARLKILDYASEYPTAVDRSVKRRAHLAMALILKPDILIVDGPLAGFDPEIANLVVQRLRRLKEDHGTTLLMASHTLEMLSQLTDSIGILEGGRIVHSGTLARIVDMLKTMDDSRLGNI